MRGKIILLVEDNPDDEALMLRALKKNNIANEIVVAHDGQEALDFLASRPAEQLPELVLLDLKLPRIDGLEVLKRMRADERTKHVPVVVLTTSVEQRDIVSSYEFGANSFVQKPVDFSEFVEATRQLGTYWLLLNKTVPKNELL